MFIRQYFKQIFSFSWQMTSSLFIPLSFHRFYLIFSLNCQNTSIELSSRLYVKLMFSKEKDNLNYNAPKEVTYVSEELKIERLM